MEDEGLAELEGRLTEGLLQVLDAEGVGWLVR